MTPSADPVRTRWLPLAAFALALSAFAWWPMLAAYPATQTGDGPYFQKMVEAARVSVARYHELPLWNPYECGGVPLWDNPESPVAAPLAWLALVVGSTRAIELWYLLHALVGFLGMWALTRHELRLSRAAAFVGAASWAFAGVHSQHLVGGHLVFVPFFYFPLAIFFWRRAERDPRHAVGLGAVVAMTMLEGGTYPLPHLILLLFVETLTRLWPRGRWLPIARAGAIAVAVAFVLSAARTLPVLDQLTHHTRPIVGHDNDAMQWSTLKEVFLARAHDRVAVGQQYVWPEYADYLGPILLSLALAGVFVAGLSHAWLLVLLVLSLALMSGSFADWAPWKLLNAHVYPFKEMRVPSRFVYSVSLVLSAYAAVAIDRVPRLLGRLGLARTPLLRSAIVALAMVGVGDVVGLGISWCASGFNGPPLAQLAPSPRLYLGGAGLAGFLDQPEQNRGRLECWGEWGFEAGAPLWTGDVPQARAIDADARVEALTRSQNTFSFDVDAARPTRVLLNSTFDRGWRSDVGAAVREGKQLAIELPPGHHHVRVEYWPHGLTVGLSLSVLGWAGVVAMWLRGGRRPRPAAPEGSPGA